MIITPLYLDAAWPWQVRLDDGPALHISAPGRARSLYPLQRLARVVSGIEIFKSERTDRRHLRHVFARLRPMEVPRLAGKNDHASRRIGHQLVRVERLAEGGLVMNHGITASDPDNRWVGLGAGEFINRYVFPHGELPHLSLVLREMALAHSVGDSVEQAYRRSTRLNKRREMMSVQCAPRELDSFMRRF